MVKPTGRHADLLKRALNVLDTIDVCLEDEFLSQQKLVDLKLDASEIEMLAIEIREFLQGFNPTENN